MKQSISDDQYILENNNVISSDSIIMDTLGHFHNNDSMICSFLKLRAKCKVDNNALLNVSHFKMEKQGVIYSPGTVNANYFDLTDYLTIFYNYYGSLSVKKHLNIASGAYVFNFNFICVDSCLTNNGVLTANASPTWTSTIKVNGLSQNTGTISLNDFCDYSSSIGGGPDINTGTLDNVTICTSTFNFCSFTIQSIRETPKEMSRIFLFPNPGTDVINLRLADQELEYTNIVILNPIGEVVFTGPFSNTINISELRAGVYFLRVTSSTINYTTKFLKG